MQTCSHGLDQVHFATACFLKNHLRSKDGGNPVSPLILIHLKKESTFKPPLAATTTTTIAEPVRNWMPFWLWCNCYPLPHQLHNDSRLRATGCPLRDRDHWQSGSLFCGSWRPERPRTGHLPKSGSQLQRNVQWNESSGGQLKPIVVLVVFLYFGVCFNA